jgi:hypothetical protein
MHRCLKLTYLGHCIARLLSWCVLQGSPTELSETEWSDSEATIVIEISDDEEVQNRNHALRAPRTCMLMLMLKRLPQEPLQPPKAASKQSGGQKPRGLNSKLSNGSTTFRHKLPAAFRWKFSSGKRLPTARKVTLREVHVVPVMKRMCLR